MKYMTLDGRLLEKEAYISEALGKMKEIRADAPRLVKNSEVPAHERVKGSREAGIIAMERLRRAMQ